MLPLCNDGKMTGVRCEDVSDVLEVYMRAKDLYYVIQVLDVVNRTDYRHRVIESHLLRRYDSEGLRYYCHYLFGLSREQRGESGTWRRSQE